jgi:hypothetical protein
VQPLDKLLTLIRSFTYSASVDFAPDRLTREELSLPRE